MVPPVGVGHEVSSRRGVVRTVFGARAILRVWLLPWCDDVFNVGSAVHLGRPCSVRSKRGGRDVYIWPDHRVDN
jgi:hypothetical protein